MLLIPERPQSLHCCQHVVSTPWRQSPYPGEGFHLSP